MRAMCLCAVLSMVLAGCINGDPANIGPGAQEATDVAFEWRIPEHVREAAFMFNITAGEATSCSWEYGFEGDMSGESALSSATLTRMGNSTGITGTGMTGVIRGGSALHLGDLNSGSANAMALGPLLGWNSWGGWRVENESWFEEIHFVSGLRHGGDLDSGLSIHCDSPRAWVRIWEADSFVPIIDRSAVGGAGLRVDPAGPSVGLNQGDSFSITTAAEQTRFFGTVGPPEDGGVAQMLEGTVTLRTPDGSESIDLEEFRAQLVTHRAWTGPGTYVVDLAQISLGYGSFWGGLAGFELAHETP